MGAICWTRRFWLLTTSAHFRAGLTPSSSSSMPDTVSGWDWMNFFNAVMYPARYEKQHTEYMTELKKFIQSHPETVSGMELELDGVNPARKWAEVVNSQKRRVQQMAPIEAQTKYLAVKVDTDLDGHALVSNLPAGDYWISSLGLTAAAGDVRLRWDVPVRVLAGQTTRLELTNLNAVNPNADSLK